MNPKAMTTGQLFGEQTHEWHDGVLAAIMRECCRAISDER